MKNIRIFYDFENGCPVVDVLMDGLYIMIIID